MYAVFTEVTMPPGIPAGAAASGLRANAVPAARAAGATGAYWLAPHDGRAIGVLLFDDQAAAQAAAAGLHVGARPKNAPDGITFRTVQVQEVIAHL